MAQTDYKQLASFIAAGLTATFLAFVIFRVYNKKPNVVLKQDFEWPTSSKNISLKKCQGCQVHDELIYKDKYDFMNVLRKYFQGRDRGLNQKKIAEKVFQVNFPMNQKGLERHSYPLITANTLRAYCNVFIHWDFNNGTLIIHPKNWVLREGDVIFVYNIQILQFATVIYPHLTKKFILVSTGDFAVPAGPYDAKMLDGKYLERWFAENPAIIHPKIEPVPRGFADRTFQYGSWEDKENILRKILDCRLEKRDKLLYINVKITPSRSHRRDYLIPFLKAGFKKIGRREPKDYLEDLSRHKFVFSPPGMGEDCHRHWESILMGAIPIVWNNTGLWPLFKKNDMLILNDNDWKDKISMSWLESLEMKTPLKKYLLAQYWFDRIDAYRLPLKRAKKKNQ